MSILSKFKKLLNTNNYRKLSCFAKGYRTKILLITALSVIASQIGIAEAIISKQLIDNAVDSNLKSATIYGALLLLFLIFELSLTSIVPYIRLRIIEPFRNKLQLHMLNHIYNKPVLDIYKFKTGDLLTRIYSDVDNIVSVLCSTIPMLFSLFLQLTIAFSLLFQYDSTLALLTFLVTPVTMLFGMIVGRKLKSIQSRIQTANGMQRSLITESLMNIIILKTYNFIEKNLQYVGTAQTFKFELMKKKNVASVKANLLLGIGYRFGFFAALVFGAYRLSSAAITFGTFTAFLQLVSQIQGPIQGLSVSLPQFISTMSSVERLDEIEMIPNEDNNSNIAEPCSTPSRIMLNQVCFSYSVDTPILNDITFDIPKGSRVGIIGLSGAGKTTLIHLLLSLIKPDSGEITVVDEHAQNYPLSPSTRTLFSYVPQENSLFSGTIRDNFLLSQEVEPSVIEKALEASCCKDFVDALPNGIDSVLSERGIGLSQGQAQRLTIARALIHQSPFLILDEASSALDHLTEKDLIDNLQKYYPDLTIIAITHREEILNICHKVYQLSETRLTTVNSTL